MSESIIAAYAVTAVPVIDPIHSLAVRADPSYENFEIDGLEYTCYITRYENGAGEPMVGHSMYESPVAVRGAHGSCCTR